MAENAEDTHTHQWSCLHHHGILRQHISDYSLSKLLNAFKLKTLRNTGAHYWRNLPTAITNKANRTVFIATPTGSRRMTRDCEIIFVLTEQSENYALKKKKNQWKNWLDYLSEMSHLFKPFLSVLTRFPNSSHIQKSTYSVQSDQKKVTTI